MTKNRENESEALAQDDQTVNADWKKWNFKWQLKVDKVSTERMCAGRQIDRQIDRHIYIAPINSKESLSASVAK